jgi:hypothetical protein
MLSTVAKRGRSMKKCDRRMVVDSALERVALVF